MNRTTRITFLIMFPTLACGLVSCGQNQQARSYEETVVIGSTPAAQSGSMAGGLPAPADIWNKQMPDDEIHAKFAKQMAEGGTMPPVMGNQPMPDDEIHAKLKQRAGQSAAMPMMEGMGAVEPGNSPISWKAPKGWTEKPGGGMRLATFVNDSPDAPIECSIVNLSGPAGGINENIIRWMRQIKISIPETRDLEEFVKKLDRIPVDKKYNAMMVDLTKLQGPDGSAASMVAAIIELPDSKVFVKMTGTKNAITGNLASFRELTQSLKIKNTP